MESFEDSRAGEQRSRSLGLVRSQSTPPFGLDASQTRILERCVIGWQEKIARPQPGTTQYRLSEQPSTERESLPDEPGEELIRAEVSQSTFKRLFTLTNEDLQPRGESQAGPQRRRVKPLDLARLKSPVISCPSDAQKRRSRSIRGENEERMAVMAYLGDADSPNYDPRDEFFLCEITLVNGRLLRVRPEFDRYHQAHSRHGQFVYRVKVKRAEEDEAEFDRLAPRRMDSALKIAEDDEQGGVDLPQPDEYWIHYSVNIERGLDFPHDGLRVDYFIELPPSFSLLRPENFSGRSQQCFTIASGHHDIANWSFPLTFTVVYRPGAAFNTLNKAFSAFRWPRLLLKITAEDEWGRRWTDGYTSINLPIEPTVCRRVVLDCWRLTPPAKDNLSRLEETFLGQAFDLVSLEELGTTKRTSSSQQWTYFHYSRAGLSTEGSGQVELAIESIHQCRAYIPHRVLRSLKYGWRGGLLKGGGGGWEQRGDGSSALEWRIIRTLEEFEAARQQLLRLGRRKIPSFKERFVR